MPPPAVGLEVQPVIELVDAVGEPEHGAVLRGGEAPPVILALVDPPVPTRPHVQAAPREPQPGFVSEVQRRRLDDADVVRVRMRPFCFGFGLFVFFWGDGFPSVLCTLLLVYSVILLLVMSCATCASGAALDTLLTRAPLW